jgi:hypothetical protein
MPGILLSKDSSVLAKMSRGDADLNKVGGGQVLSEKRPLNVNLQASSCTEVGGGRLRGYH